ncbi:MAG TPA: class II glutamine amidotransferase [Solirubrobacteraceae bacterium]|nr:class II glutamine amidotransferase [Solirubrobacteraceae bacterium]
MCRLFGMSSGPEPATATFWLLDAPDSLARQSHENPDGTGIGFYDREGRPHVEKQPTAAYDDRRFAAEAREIRSRTVVSHVRHATTGALTVANTHPFILEGRIFAHNGVIDDLPALEAELGPEGMALVGGETDSERYGALITREAARAGGDVGAGIRAAAEWTIAHLELLSINCILISAGELWALRYPATHTLFVLQRRPGGAGPGAGALDVMSHHGTRVHSDHGTAHPMVVVASERMDDDPDWRELEVGELIHVDSDLRVSSERLGQPAR